MLTTHHRFYVRGHTRTTVLGTTGCKTRKESISLKNDCSAQLSLEHASMEFETLEIAGHEAAVKRFPGLLHTARQTI